MKKNNNIFYKYGYGWVTLGLFLFSLAGHWIFGWFAFANEQMAHHQPIEMNEFFVITMRDMLENWQSEFLQLIWQVAGLTYLLYVGSPQSRGDNDRVEDKVDAILRRVDPLHAEDIIEQCDAKSPRN